LLAGRNCRAIQLWEHGREVRQAVGQCMTLHDLGAYAHHDVADARALGLLGDRLQRFVQWQAGTHEG